MQIALWTIAICEIIRAVQNMIQLYYFDFDARKREDLYEEFINSLKCGDKEIVKSLLEEFEKRSMNGDD